MPAGRPPKPIELKRRQGNPGKRALPKTTVALLPQTGIPPTPTRLGIAGRKFWATVWERGTWLSPELDTTAVERCCRLVTECQLYEREIARYGLMIERYASTPLGEILTHREPNPAVKALREAEKQLQSWLSTLGFDPTARSRLGYAEVKTKSKLEELMERRSRNAG